MAASAEPTASQQPAWTPEALAGEQVFLVMGAASHQAELIPLSAMGGCPSSMAQLEAWAQQEMEALEEAEEAGTAAVVGAVIVVEMQVTLIIVTAVVAEAPTT